MMWNSTSPLYAHLEANDVEFNLTTLCARRSTLLGSKCQSFAKCEMHVVGDFFWKCTLTMRLSSSPTMINISGVFVVHPYPWSIWRWGWAVAQPWYTYSMSLLSICVHYLLSSRVRQCDVHYSFNLKPRKMYRRRTRSWSRPRATSTCTVRSSAVSTIR